MTFEHQLAGRVST